ncbi:MAG: hypothetical protein L6R39_007745 [Caloplaca ligustica]|nr:MAG: hypothetical protein L6R39_007745 [Caloplaca ligustica]
MRAQRNSLPRTPRTSLDEPGKVEDTSPVVNGKPQASSTISGTDSCVDDVQSEIDPGEIMNARSAEVIHRQGTFGYHGRAANKPPRSGPAPTRALPSLPEGHDGVVMHPSAKLTNLTPTAPASQAATGGLPKTKGPQSPPKGHRYRLSPIKNNLRQETSIPHELEPSPKFTEEFPQPPQSLVPAVPDKSREASPARRNRKVDVSQVVAGLRTESQDLNQNAALFKGDDAHETLDLWNFPSVAGTEPSSEHPVVLPQKLSDPDENDLYIPWQASRVKRVKALKLRDMERLRSRQGSAISPKSLAGNNGVSTNPRSNGEAADHKFSSQSLSLPPVQTTEDLRPLTQSDLSPNKRPSSLSTRNELSPIIVIASQPPCPSKQPDRASPNSSHLNHTISPKAIGVRPPTLQCPVHSTLDPTPPLNRAPSPTTAGRQSSSCLHSQHSYTSLTNHTSYTAELEARIAAMEKKNLLLERAFMAVIDATAGFGSALSGRGSSGCERGSWTQEGGPERLSATSDVLAPSVGKVENMLMEMQAKVGRLG